jgi:hypothetical protein
MTNTKDNYKITSKYSHDIPKTKEENKDKDNEIQKTIKKLYRSKTKPILNLHDLNHEVLIKELKYFKKQCNKTNKLDLNDRRNIRVKDYAYRTQTNEVFTKVKKSKSCSKIRKFNTNQTQRDRKSTRQNSSHHPRSRMPSSA